MQVQTFVPAAEARRVFDDQVQMMQSECHESFLAVLKEHRSDNFALSHGVDGFSLALDLKVTEANRAHIWGLAGRMQALVLASGGRFYLAKDSTLTPEQFQASIGPEGLARHRAARAHFDPEGLLTTAQGTRLGLA